MSSQIVRKSFLGYTTYRVTTKNAEGATNTFNVVSPQKINDFSIFLDSDNSEVVEVAQQDATYVIKSQEELNNEYDIYTDAMTEDEEATEIKSVDDDTTSANELNLDAYEKYKAAFDKAMADANISLSNTESNSETQAADSAGSTSNSSTSNSSTYNSSTYNSSTYNSSTETNNAAGTAGETSSENTVSQNTTIQNAEIQNKYGVRDGFDAYAVATSLHEAMKGGGTDEETVMKYLGYQKGDDTLNDAEILEVMDAYEEKYGKALEKDIRGDFSYSAQKQLLARLENANNQTSEKYAYASDEEKAAIIQELAGELYDAMYKAGTDEQKLLEIMQLDPEIRKKVIEYYDNSPYADKHLLKEKMDKELSNGYQDKIDDLYNEVM